MSEKNIYEILSKVQQELSVPKSRTNKFGGYAYRSLEDINAAAKPICKKYDCGYIFKDEIIPYSIDAGTGRWYLCSTITFFVKDCEKTIETKAYAREEDIKKGMDDAQITGLASSYARKYAACALFAIDSGEEVDALDNEHLTQSKTDSEASEEAINVLMGKVSQYAEIAGKKSVEVLEALYKTETMLKLGCTPKTTHLTAKQANAADQIVSGWIKRSTNARN